MNGHTEDRAERRRAARRKWANANKEHARTKTREWRKNNPERFREQSRRNHQTERQKPTQQVRTKRCHATGFVRGLLCNACNRLLGCARDNTTIIERAAEYLKTRRQ